MPFTGIRVKYPPLKIYVVVQMLEINPFISLIKDMQWRIKALRGIFEYDAKSERLVEINRELEDPKVWENPKKAQALGKERVSLEKVINTIVFLCSELSDAEELLELIREENNEDLMQEVNSELQHLSKQLDKLEFHRMFSNKMDPNNAFVDIQSGSGGTEAQDWAEMLLRMYLRWGEQHEFKTELMEVSSGDVAGIKSAAIRFIGDHAFGWLRTEAGVHRLVRKSPFDSGNRRHTSFASIFVSPEIDDDIDIEINPADLRVDTYRASGAGGQHVNKTESAVRLTHIPSKIVVQCQNDRSQHKNKDHAMKQLRAKLYEMEMLKRSADKQELKDTKTDIGWGSQIRSYVLDQSRIKDLRTGVGTGNTTSVLDGDLDKFIEASLKAGL